MSQTQSYKVSCPKCGHVQDVELFEAINVAASPELREKLLADLLNAVACAGCAFRFRVDKPLLYNDAKRRILIYWMPAGPQPAEQREEAFRQSMDAMIRILPEGFEPPPVHLVLTRCELVERIFLLEAGLNERIIEYIKFMIYSRNSGKVDVAKKNLLFDAEDSNAESLCFVVQDVATQRLESMLQYSREAYTALCETFDQDEHTARLLEMFPGPHISARALLLKEAARS